MRACLILLRRELGAYFVSWTGYVVIAAVLFLIGLGFVGLIEAINTEPIAVSVVELFFESHYFWLILLFAAPLITMRTFAREKATGTLETLMTAPVRDIDIILAKFGGAVVFYILMWLPLIGCMLIVQHFAGNTVVYDYGKIISVFTGIILVGLLYMAMGCFASSLATNQMSAAIAGYVGGIALFILGYLSYALTPQSGWLAEVLSYINLIEHIKDFSRGVIDTRPVVFYITTCFLFLYLTLKTVESRRWK